MSRFNGYDEILPTAFSKVALVLLKVILLKPDIGFRFISNSWADFSKNTQKELRKR